MNCETQVSGWDFELINPAEAIPKIREAAKKAILLDPTLAEPHAMLAAISLRYWDWEDAGVELRRALELNPSYAQGHAWYGQYLCMLGRFEEGIAEDRRAVAIDPINPTRRANLGLRLYWARRYSDAIDPIRSSIRNNSSWSVSYRYLGQVHEQLHMYSAAIASLQENVALTDEMPTSWAALGHAYAIARDEANALKLLAHLRRLSKERFVSGYSFALIYVGLGRKKEALAALEEAYPEHSGWMSHLKVDPRLDPLRSDPRFQDLLARVGLGKHSP